MFGLTVLSPHRDDAAFSLFELLSLARSVPWHLTVINFFTVSSYAPIAGLNEAGVVSAIRKHEDRRVLAAIDAGLRVRDRGMLDAPLRLGIPAKEVCSQDPSDKAFPAIFMTALELQMKTSVRELVLAPLSLGEHIDHRSVHQAALNSVPAHRLAFYEDLPYATWAGSEKLAAKICKAEQHTNRRLSRFHVSPLGELRRRKQQVIRQYSSQIASDEATRIALWGERIWVPAHSCAWAKFLNSLPKAFGKRPFAVNP